MYCTKCGVSLAPESAFCAACGQPIANSGDFAPAVAAQPSPHTNVTNAPSHSYAGFWLRLVAFLIDTIILLIAAAIVLRVFRRFLGIPPFGMLAPDVRASFRVRRLGAFQLIGGIAVWLYFALMESSAWQATLGKKIMGLYVTDLRGQRISFARATGRYFAKIISNFTLLIGYLMAGFTARKQALHDMIAGSLVWKNA